MEKDPESGNNTPTTTAYEDESLSSTGTSVKIYTPDASSAGSEWLVQGATESTHGKDQVAETDHGKGGLKTPTGEEAEMNELSQRVQDLELDLEKRSTGALRISVGTASAHSARITAHAYWNGTKASNLSSSWEEEVKGYGKIIHASFEPYSRKRFIKQRHKSNSGWHFADEEDSTFFDPESSANYQNVHPGTLTVEGFGLECWEYEVIYGAPRYLDVEINRSELPNIPAKKLLRRLHELRCGLPPLGWNIDQELEDLKEVVGNLGIKYYDRRYTTDTLHWIGNLYSLLNRRDVFADFCSSSTVIGQWSGQSQNSIGPWDFLRQIIVTFELARRLEDCDSAAMRPGFTKKVLASLIVTDQWMRNVEVVLSDEKIDASKYQSPANEKERATAERLKEQADAAARSGDHDRAVTLYSEAMNIDLANARYRIGRSKSFFAINKYDEAADDAYVATQLDLQDVNAWEQLAISQLSRGQSKKAKEAYEKAIEAAGSDATDQMRQGLVQADALIDTDLKMMDEETDFEKREHIWKSYFEQDWDLLGKTLQIHSHVHERQTEGLLLFAERLKWPYVDELRDYAEDVYSNLRGGGMIPLHLYDWIFGLSLPGQWFSFKIMSALILCTPSIAQDIGAAPYSDCGLSLPRQSYWRTQTALGRVLGALSGVISLNGWIGPCPPIEFYPPIGDVKAHHIRINSRRVAPIEYIPPKDGVIFVGPRHGQWEALRMQPNEEIGIYMQDMTDSDKWIIPEPPIQQVGTCEMQAIRLKQLPLDTAVAGIRNMSAQQVQNETQYRASITFQVDNNNGPISYILYTNPVFVTLPPCFPGVKGAHEIHVRELARMQKNIVTVENLKQTVSTDDPDDVLVINSTGHGAAEVLARAWCSERGKNAAIRRMGGPCFSCAFRAASKQGLGVGVLIWVS